MASEDHPVLDGQAEAMAPDGRTRARLENDHRKMVAMAGKMPLSRVLPVLNYQIQVR